MKKRFLSIVLALCMVMALMPQTAVAAESDWENKIWIGNTPVNLDNLSGDGWNFKNGGGGKYILELKAGFICVGSTKLPNSNDKAVIQIRSLQNITIKLLGDAIIGVPSTEFLPPEGANGISTYGIYAPETNLAIEGTGTLNISSNANAIWCKDLRVEGSTLNCNSFRTAIRVMDSSASIDNAATRGNMLVKSGATVTAKTTCGSGFYPQKYAAGAAWDYQEKGGAALLVSGSLTVEDSIVNAENS